MNRLGETFASGRRKNWLDWLHWKLSHQQEPVLSKLEILQDYYSEHTARAAKHEEQRERITGIILTIAGLLIGLVTFAKLSMWALSASIPIAFLGVYGYLFSGKHYERFKYHTQIVRGIRKEIELMEQGGRHQEKSFSAIRAEAEEAHYSKFTWPKLSGGSSQYQNKAKSWIARQRLHIFWEFLHLLIAFMGVGLSVAILAKNTTRESPEIIKVQMMPTEPLLNTPPSLPGAPQVKRK